MNLILIATVLSSFNLTGFNATFVLYLTETLHYKSDEAFMLMGMVGSLMYGFPLLSGKLTDKYLNPLCGVALGAILQVIGMVALVLDGDTLLYGVALYAIGYAFLKPNIAAVFGETCDGKSNKERDAGFSLFYSMINLGGFFAPLLYGFWGAQYGWHQGFLISVLSLVLMIGLLPQKRAVVKAFGSLKKDQVLKILGSIIAMLLLSQFLLDASEYAPWFLGGCGLLLILFFKQNYDKSDAESRKNYPQLLLIFFSCMVFFALFEQKFLFLPLFIDQYVHVEIWNFVIPAPWFSAINPFIVIGLGIWASHHLKKKKETPQGSFASKSLMAFSLLGAGFWILSYGCSTSEGQLSSFYIISLYTLHSIGEILLIPFALSTVSRLAGPKQKSIFMGMFYLTLAGARPLAAIISSNINVDEGVVESLDSFAIPLFSVGMYAILFGVIVWGVSKGVRIWRTRSVLFQA